MPASDDPFVPPDTSHRPRPGAGRRGAPEPTFTRAPMGPAVQVEPLSAEQRARLTLGLNPLVQAASPVLLLIGSLRGASASMDVGGLRRHALEEIRRFEEQAHVAGIRNEIVLAARYALCAGLDEAVLSTPWGAQSEWAQHPLLVALHREAWGGEKFFDMLDRISVDPARHVDLMELQYLILALGFTGKYQMMPRGHEQLADLQQALYRKIRSERGQAPQDLALLWRGLEDRRNRLIRYVPWWVVGAAALAVLAVTFVVYYSRLGTMAEPITAKLERVGLEAIELPPPGPPPPQTLKQLLKPQEDRGALTVTEKGRESIVTLPSSADVFASGSADINPAYESTLEQIAIALNKVRGRVTIVGHTDGQPIKSFRYQNNYQLSRERAASVAAVLRRTLTPPGSLDVQGKGDSQPLVEETTPENRARNRRVEIVHIR
jgi:type VI secretion system protein ImpK